MFKVTGVKTFVTNGGYADSYVVSTTAADLEAPMDQFSCIIVPRESAGLKWGAAWHGLGLRGNASRTLELKEAQVPRQNLLGQEGDQLWYIFHIVTPYFLAAMAGTYLGLAGAALAEAKTHLSRRHFAHSGTKLAQLSLLQHRLGTLWGMVERTRRLIYFAAHEVDTGGPEALPAIFTAKAEVADCAVSVVNEALTLSGGIAYQNDSKLPRLLRDARAAHVMSPTTDMLRIWTGRALLDQPLLGE
jgi:alkylation response protein AidB-like acyl-CoA dehydrogenase